MNGDLIQCQVVLSTLIKLLNNLAEKNVQRNLITYTDCTNYTKYTFLCKLLQNVMYIFSHVKSL